MPLAILYDCTSRFVSDLVGHPEDRFSDVAAHIMIKLYTLYEQSSFGQVNLSAQ